MATHAHGRVGNPRHGRSTTMHTLERIFILYLLSYPQIIFRRAFLFWWSYPQGGMARPFWGVRPSPPMDNSLFNYTRHLCFHGLGGRCFLEVPIGLLPCKDPLLGARWARLILRKPAGLSGGHFFPADAFCTRRPWVRASSSHLLQIKKNSKSQGGQASTTH